MSCIHITKLSHKTPLSSGNTPQSISGTELSFRSIHTLRTETKTAEFANSIDLDEVALNEPPHLDLHCLPSSL